MTMGAVVMLGRIITGKPPFTITQAAPLAREVGVDAAKINDEPFRGGGEATAAILGYKVAIGNWHGIHSGPGITPEQRKALIDMIVKATKTKSWLDALEKNN